MSHQIQPINGRFRPPPSTTLRGRGWQKENPGKLSPQHATGLRRVHSGSKKHKHKHTRSPPSSANGDNTFSPSSSTRERGTISCLWHGHRHPLNACPRAASLAVSQSPTHSWRFTTRPRTRATGASTDDTDGHPAASNRGLLTHLRGRDRDTSQHVARSEETAPSGYSEYSIGCVPRRPPCGPKP